MKKQIFNILVVLCMIATLFIDVTYANETDLESYSNVDISTVESNQKSIIKRTRTLAFQDTIITDNDGNPINGVDGVYDMLATEGWKLDKNTNILTLSGLNLDTSSGSSIMMTTNGTIELIGENFIKNNFTGAIMGYQSLTIGGEGSLNVDVNTNEGPCIFTDKDLNITGGTLNLKSQYSNAIYTPGNITITGGDVTVNGYYCGLQANLGNIIISNAKVSASSSNDASIFAGGTSDIKNNSKVDVTESKYAGLNAKGGITITDSKADIISGVGYTAIYTPKDLVIGGTSEVTANGSFRAMQGDEGIIIKGNAKVIADGNDTAIQSMNVEISDNAIVKATSITQNAISGKDNLSINGNADVVAKGYMCGILAENTLILSAENIEAVAEKYYGVRNENGDIIIGGKLLAEAGEGHAISTKKNIVTDINADITVTGAWAGIQADGDITFSGSKVSAVGNGDAGIRASGLISFNEGNVYAKGGEGYVAIRAKNLQDADEIAVSKITYTNMIEKNGAKIAFCDWYLYDGEKTSWTTFIAKDEDTLITNDSGGVSNGLNEIWLAPPLTVTFDINGANGVSSEQKTYPGNKVSAPETNPTKEGYHFSGWYLDGAKFDFSSPITNDITLKSQLDTHVPGPEATTEHSQVCSICGYELAPKLPLKNIVLDNVTGIKVEYMGEFVFDADIILSIIEKSQVDMDEYKDIIDKVALGQVLGGLYDLKLLKNGVAIQPNGKIKVSIPITEKMKTMNDLQVIYIDDSGNISVIPSEIMNEKIVFVTDHLSNYGVIGKVKVPNNENNEVGNNNSTNIDNNINSPQTGDSTSLLLLAIGLMTSVIIYSNLIKKTKSDSNT